MLIVFKDGVGYVCVLRDLIVQQQRGYGPILGGAAAKDLQRMQGDSDHLGDHEGMETRRALQVRD
jgi:hypothetical protein